MGQPQRVCVPHCGQLLPQRSPCPCVLRAPSSGPGPAGLTTVLSTEHTPAQSPCPSAARQGPALREVMISGGPAPASRAPAGKWLLVSTLGLTVLQLTDCHWDGGGASQCPGVLEPAEKSLDSMPVTLESALPSRLLKCDIATADVDGAGLRCASAGAPEGTVGWPLPQEAPGR